MNISPFASQMSLHGGDVVVATGSLVHWCMTGDASSSHGYALTDMQGNIVVNPVMRWQLDDGFQTYVWAFATNSRTYGQPVIKNERGVPLPNDEFMFIMNRVPTDTKFQNRDWNSAYGTIPRHLRGLHIHKNINYAFGSLSLQDIFTRIR